MTLFDDYWIDLGSDETYVQNIDVWLYSVQTLLDNETKSLPMLSYNKQVNEIN